MAGTISYNGVPVPADSPLGIELQKWERPQGYDPDKNQYPRMLYIAHKRPDGTFKCMEGSEVPDYLYPNPGLLDKELTRIKMFNESCQKIVRSEREEKDAYSHGWRRTPQEAEKSAKGEILDEKLVAAAEFAYEVRNMSENAKEEIRIAEASTPEVLTDMTPELLKEVGAKKRGRPKKVVVA